MARRRIREFFPCRPPRPYERVVGPNTLDIHEPMRNSIDEVSGGALTISRFAAPALLAALTVFAVPARAATAAPVARASDLPVVRVGTLKFGTVDWELDVMRRHGLDRAHGFIARPVDFAGKDGIATALQGHAVDVILTDWLWVAKSRALGGDFVFAPYSRLTGGVMVRRNAGISRLADLKGRRIGIGGGPTDKSWIVLRAYAQKTAGFDPAIEATPVFAAPPLLNETLRRGGVAAAINFWQYDARLDTGSFFELIRVEDMLPAVGLPAHMPLLGWVFSERWAARHTAALDGYLAAVAAARDILATRPEEWQAIKGLTGARDDEMLARLRTAYLQGIPAGGSPSTGTLAAAAQRMIDILVELGDQDEVPPGDRLPRGTFYVGFHS
jgi:NitT/TauT family transport system substrate-binding protein